MHKQFKNQAGFTHHLILPVLAIVAVAGIGTYIISKSSASTTEPVGKVYTLPAGASRPSPLEPQSAAVGAGANPVISTIPDAVWSNMVGKSWHSGCPIGRGSLSLMKINYWGFDGKRYRGEMVVRSMHASKFKTAFAQLYTNNVPLHGMYRPDRFGYSSKVNGANDYASMQHNNTSAFNCRWVVGNPGTMSPHSLGTAVDINPYLNPYKSAQGWVPNQEWVNRNIQPYNWRKSTDLVVQIMLSSGFKWTYGVNDSQHFDIR